MRGAHRNKAAVVAIVTVLSVLGLSMSSLAADSPRITEGSNVTLLYQITVPGEKLEVRDVGQFVQGQHQLLPVLERVVTGLKSGDEKKIDLSAEEGFGVYDANKKKTVPRSDLPPDTKEGDVMQDRAGQQATVTHMSDQSAVMDYNHPLAGKPLHVSLKILRVDDPVMTAQPNEEHNHSK